jgi:hypothetical protein
MTELPWIRFPEPTELLPELPPQPYPPEEERIYPHPPAPPEIPPPPGEGEIGHEMVVADAKSRSKRTFVQGLGIDLAVATVAVILAFVGQDPFNRNTWILLGALLAKTLVQTVASYVMRLRVTPTIRGEKLALMPVPRP